jgi:leader peptidase (prepilin peptidase)/N-methyltransferase
MTSYPFFNLLQQHHEFWLTGATLFSLLVGSFLNVVIVRLPKAMHLEWQQECRFVLNLEENHQQVSSPALASIAWPGSHCPNCHIPLKAWHNIPVISYLLLRGKCAFCTIHINPRYPLVELLTAALGLLVAWLLEPSLATVMALMLVYMLVALTFIDLDHKLLPDQLTLPLMWLGLVVNAFGLFTSLQDAFWGAVAGYMSLWLVYWGFRLATGKHGMGYGDFKLLAALGAWLGWQALPIIVLVAAVTGIIVGLALRIRAVQTDPQVPFGPFLSAGGLAYLLWGDPLWRVFQLS